MFFLITQLNLIIWRIFEFRYSFGIKYNFEIVLSIYINLNEEF